MTITYEHPSLATRPPDPVESPVPMPCTAEIAECTCPEFCERDHDNE